MKDFHELEFKKPPYPVFKAYLVPYRDGDEVKSVRGVKEEDIKDWGTVLNELKKFLSESFKFAESTGKKFDEVEKMELTCDLIALFFRLPLLREVLGTVAPSPLKMYLFYRLIGIEDERPIELMKMFYAKEITPRFLESPINEIISDPKLSNLIENCWFKLPSDTRPSFNTSGLIPHLLLSSALAWTLAIQEGLDSKKAVMLRLAAMLHDIGKPFNYANHIEPSVKVVELLLDYLDTKDEIKEFVKEHHSKADTQEARILSKADKIAAAVDRIEKLSQEVIGEEINSICKELQLDPNDAYASGPKGWNFWSKISEKKEVMEMSKKFVETLRNKLENYTKPLQDSEGETIDGVQLALIDIASIQSFVYSSWELRNVVASSLLVDFIIMAYLPLYFQTKIAKKERVWFPYEAILYSAGGIVELIFPSKLIDTVRELCEGGRLLENIRLRFASVNLKNNYAATKLNLAEAMEAEKFTIRHILSKIKYEPKDAVRNLCELCYKVPPKDEPLSTPEGLKRACSCCKELYELGGELHFKRRYDSEIFIKSEKYIPRKVFDLTWEKADQGIAASEKIIELISGHDKNELSKLSGGTDEIRERNIGIIKLDGNLMGSFMATCISPSDAYERSARIDLALKKAIEYAIENLFEGVKEASMDNNEAAKAALAVKLGIIYAGGDDALVLVPSWCSPTFASILAREFLNNLGGSRGLAIGLAVAPAKANLWTTISAASKLMDEAKSACRENPSLSAICFDIVEGGMLSEDSAEIRLKTLKDEFLTSQPLLIGNKDCKYEVLLSLVLGDYNNFAEAFSKSYLLSRFPNICSNRVQIEQFQKEAKRIRSSISKTLSITRSKVKVREYVPLVSSLYIRRQIERAREERGETALIYEKILRLTPAKLGETSLFADLDRIIKILGGGAL